MILSGRYHYFAISCTAAAYAIVKNVKKYLCCCLLALLMLQGNLNIAHAQAAGNLLLEKHYTDDNGLPQNSVKCIIPDQYGFLWLGTENGIVRFDGKNFRLYNSVSLGTTSDRTNYMFADDHHHIHAFIEDEVIDIDQGAVGSRYWKWLPPYSFHEYALRYNKSLSFPASSLPNLYQGYLHLSEYIIPGEDDQAYIIGRDSITLRKNQQTLKAIAFGYGDFLSFFFLEKELYHLDHQGRLTGFHNMQAQQQAICGDITAHPSWQTKLNRSALYWNLAADQLFIYLDSTLYLVTRLPGGDLNTRKLLSHLDLPGISAVTLYYNTADKRLFIGSQTNGLYVFGEKKFTTFGDEPGVDAVYYAQAPFGAHGVITPTGNAYDSAYKATAIKGLRQAYTSDKRRDKYSMLRDYRQHIWYKTQGYLSELDATGNNILHQYHLSDAITQIYEDDHHRLWIGTYNHGTWYLDEGEQQSLKVFHPNLHHVMYFQEDKDGYLWVAPEKGLLRVNISNRHTDTIPGLEHICVRSLYVKGPHEIWISTANHGFFLYDGNKLTAFPLDARQYLSVVHCIIPDEAGYLWLSTNKGLFQAARKDLLEYARQPQGNIFYLYYARDAGFNTNEFNGGCEPCAIKLDDGRISLPSMNGLVAFSTREKIAELPDKALFIDKITAGEQEYKDRDTIWLPHHFKPLKLEISTPYFGNDYNLQIDYAWLSGGKDTSWLDISDNQTLTFSSLPSGAHQLVIRKANGFGNNNYTCRSLVLMVAPAYFETTWFRLLIVMIVIICVYVYIRLRVYYLKKSNAQLEAHVHDRTKELATSESRLRAQMQMQEKLVAAISHDIKTPMKYLVHGAERVIDRNLSYNEMKEEVGMIYDTAYRMYFLLDNLVGYVKTHLLAGEIRMEEMDLYELLEEKKAIFDLVAAARDTAIVLQEQRPMKIHSNPLILGIIIHNLLDNAVKYTENGQVLLSAHMRGQWADITITDKGTGFQPEILAWVQKAAKAATEAERPASVLHYGIGLSIVLELLPLVNGQLDVQSAVDKGTTITISIAV